MRNVTGRDTAHTSERLEVPVARSPREEPRRCVIDQLRGGRVVEHAQDHCQVGTRERRINRHGMPGFTEFFLRLLHHERQVRIARRGQRERLLQRNLPACTGQQIGAPHHVGDVLRGIVDGYRELIGDNSVSALDDNIAQLMSPESTVSLYSIVEKHHATVSYAKAGRGRYTDPCWSVAAGARVTGVFVAGQLAPRATALEGMSARLELLHSSNVYVVALALIYDITVPVEAESLQGAQDSLRAAGYDPGRIEILDADEPLAAVMACVEIASGCRQKRAEMQIARGRRGEATYVGARRVGCRIMAQWSENKVEK